MLSPNSPIVNTFSYICSLFVRTHKIILLLSCRIHKQERRHPPMSENKFFTRFQQLCRDNGISPNALGRQLGASSGSITAWKQGALPRPAMLRKIAEYFSVTTQYLTGTDEPTITDEQLKFALFGGDKPITDAMLEEVRQFAQFLKSRQ